MTNGQCLVHTGSSLKAEPRSSSNFDESGGTVCHVRHFWECCLEPHVLVVGFMAARDDDGEAARSQTVDEECDAVWPRVPVEEGGR